MRQKLVFQTFHIFCSKVNILQTDVRDSWRLEDVMKLFLLNRTTFLQNLKIKYMIILFLWFISFIYLCAIKREQYFFQVNIFVEKCKHNLNVYLKRKCQKLYPTNDHSRQICLIKQTAFYIYVSLHITLTRGHANPGHQKQL